MKILPLLVVAEVLLAGRLARADVFLDAKYEMPLSSLNAIARELGRTGDGFFVTRIQESINLVCPSQQPDTHGNGCELTFRSKNSAQLGEIGLRIAKTVSKERVIAAHDRALAETSAIDPNSTEGDLYFGNPLYSVADDIKDGTHFYCAPEGLVGTKAWKCYLSVVEALSPNPIR